jgi:hypothetical protein
MKRGTVNRDGKKTTGFLKGKFVPLDTMHYSAAESRYQGNLGMRVVERLSLHC